MRERTFLTLLILLAALGILLTAAHLAYAIWAYRHCSIIYFIAKELW